VYFRKHSLYFDLGNELETQQLKNLLVAVFDVLIYIYYVTFLLKDGHIG